MNRIIIIICLAGVLFSCKSKKSVVTKKPNTTTRDVRKTTETPSNTKVYASNTERYVDVHRETAQQEMSLYGIPASITLAQGILESGSGNGRLAVEANNHFGIKCHGWTGQKIYHDDDAAQECFRKYKDAKYSFRDHSLFLTERSRYSKLFKLKQEDYKGWAKGLRAAGYATDPKYPQKLISLIERYKLYEFDKAVLGDNYVSYKSPVTSNRTTYTVVKGDTLYSISRRYNISVKELQNLNGLPDSAISIGQELVVKPSTKN
ncbi:LysM peptidoglycan-binding domain-containing protein [Algibacter amylolyticus]|uniref:Peptidoglycan hydrolase n=1 Tax=Algibacter amylolyticus TaxID=1608400 RepID=A0A5M7B995_9FLAO|nr:glucosaminidase domain-containing protein [Algibacter amylolyticus]KAA5826196.1 LysM peptidoglycan-binding domain-containing protein [Algibacter amylolyticus]MBB5268397.1 flagellum-specific peptidoglycan hydrolase FlgJ [Algibacter amylolyticus]TSJ80234.1 LysM peptidoglycan-binding domain-containing protein [Algibacter amylolyticus]